MTELPRRTVTGVLYGAAAFVAALTPWPVFAAVLLVVGSVATSELLALRRGGVAALAEGVMLGTGLVALFWLRLVGSGAVVFVLIVTWVADVAAYLVGSRFGSRKLVPRLSPGKTWEGTIAGFVAAGLTVFAIGTMAGETGARTTTWTLALLVGPAALAGDLLESWVKRRAGVKDSGSIFPGHGGMLDRIDSLLAVAILAVAVSAPRV